MGKVNWVSIYELNLKQFKLAYNVKLVFSVLHQSTVSIFCSKCLKLKHKSCVCCPKVTGLMLLWWNITYRCFFYYSCLTLVVFSNRKKGNSNLVKT